MDQDHSIPVIEASSPTPNPDRGSIGSVLAIILIVILLVIGAFYVWGQRISEQRANEFVPAAP
jgi:hypothetical protein